MWLIEDPWPPMLICGVLGLLFVGWWGSCRRVFYLALGVSFFLLGGAIYVVEQVIVSPAEEVEQQTTLLCQQFQQKDPAMLDLFSATAPDLKAMAAGAMALVSIGDDLRLTDFQTRVMAEGSRVVCHFRANATLSVTGMGNVGRQPARFELTWNLEPDGWKIVSVRRLNPIRDEEMPLLERQAG